MRACKTCAFYATYNEKDSTGFLTGCCKRFPPSVPSPESEGDMYLEHCEHICVLEDDWCGEWRAKAKESGKTSANMRVTKRKSVASKRTAS